MGGSTHKGNTSVRGRSSSTSSFPFAVVLLLAFAAALVGVMVVHKLRERRIFHLLVKDKEHQISSLHLLLQRERDYNKEVKKKEEEMRGKLYVLRTQKMEMDRRFLEMQSTIDSLKDEHETLGLALQEKQNEIQMLSERLLDSGNNTHRVKEDAKNRDDELQDLKPKTDIDLQDSKPKLQNPYKIWSVSTDDPSNSEANLTGSQNMTLSEKKEVENGEEDKQESTNVKDADADASVKGEGEAKIVSTNQREADNTTKVKELNQTMVDTAVLKDMITFERSHMERLPENSGNGNHIEVSSDQQDIKKGKTSSSIIRDRETGAANSIEAIKQTIDADTNDINRDGTLEKRRGSQVNQENSMGGFKLDDNETSGADAGFRPSRKHARLSRTKGRKWKTHVKKRRLENEKLEGNEVNEAMRSKDGQEETEGVEDNRERRSRTMNENMEAEDTADRENLENRKVNANRVQSSEKENHLSEKLYGSSLDKEAYTNRSTDGLSANNSNRTDDEADNNTTGDEQESSKATEGMEAIRKQEAPENTEVEDDQETEEENTFKELVSNSDKEDNEEYTDQTDESEI